MKINAITMYTEKPMEDLSLLSAVATNQGLFVPKRKRLSKGNKRKKNEVDLPDGEESKRMSL